MISELVFARPFINDPIRRLDSLLNMLSAGNEPDWPFGSLCTGQCATNVCEDEQNLYVEMEVPGVEEKNIEISLVGTELNVHINRPEEQPGKNIRILRQERNFGETTRVINLPMETPPKEMSATVEHGILTIRFKKPDAVLPQKIQIVKK